MMQLMRLSGVISVLIVISAIVVCGILTFQPTPTKTVNITIPDFRIDAHETRIQTLEEWAQRHGMKY
jgi:hypothetical protein